MSVAAMSESAGERGLSSPASSKSAPLDSHKTGPSPHGSGKQTKAVPVSDPTLISGGGRTGPDRLAPVAAPIANADKISLSSQATSSPDLGTITAEAAGPTAPAHSAAPVNGTIATPSPVVSVVSAATPYAPTVGSAPAAFGAAGSLNAVSAAPPGLSAVDNNVPAQIAAAQAPSVPAVPPATSASGKARGRSPPTSPAAFLSSVLGSNDFNVGVQIIAGAAEVVGGAVVGLVGSPTVVMGVGGGLAVADGIRNIIDGIRSARAGHPVTGLVQEAVRGYGGSAADGNRASAALDVASIIGGGSGLLKVLSEGGSVVAKMAGGISVAGLIDDGVASGREVVSGKSETTAAVAGLEGMGMSEQQAQATSTGIQIAAGIGSMHGMFSGPKAGRTISIRNPGDRERGGCSRQGAAAGRAGLTATTDASANATTTTPDPATTTAASSADSPATKTSAETSAARIPPALRRSATPASTQLAHPPIRQLVRPGQTAPLDPAQRLVLPGEAAPLDPAQRLLRPGKPQPSLAPRPRPIGVIGGVGPAADADFMGKIIEETAKLIDVQKDQDHVPAILVRATDMPDRTAALLGGGESPGPRLIAAAQTLRKAGAGALVVICNTAHAWEPLLSANAGIPVLHIVDAAIKQAREVAPDARTIGLMATSGTVAARIYQEKLGAMGYRVITPDADAQRDLVMGGIYGGEGFSGVKSGDLEEGGRRLNAAAQQLVAREADVLFLACTEIPLVVSERVNGVPTVDPTRALARDAAQWYLSQSEHAASPIVVPGARRPAP